MAYCQSFRALERVTLWMMRLLRRSRMVYWLLPRGRAFGSDDFDARVRGGLGSFWLVFGALVFF